MSKRALRYSSVEAMPESMRRLVQKGGNVPGVPACSTANVPAVVAGTGERRAKYGNQVTHVDGIRFDSKREARYYEQLKLRKAAGEVSYWLRQVPIHLPGGTRYVIDFLVFFVDGRAPDYVDVKGRETKEFRIKKREVEHQYPLRIVLA